MLGHHHLMILALASMLCASDKRLNAGPPPPPNRAPSSHAMIARRTDTHCELISHAFLCFCSFSSFWLCFG
jgi:hypothetical protein